MQKFFSGFALFFLFIPPVFINGPVGSGHEAPGLLDSAYLTMVSAFAQKGVPITFNSNPLLYAELQKWLGTPHIRRNRGRGGIDCSGLVKVVFRQVYGMELTGSSKDLSRQARQIDIKDLQEGDLVFFKIYGQSRIDHVGIYLANGRFIHTSASSGVIVSELSQAYYRRRFTKAGRILPETPAVALLAENQ